jgi:hypothetical protein
MTKERLFDYKLEKFPWAEKCMNCKKNRAEGELKGIPTLEEGEEERTGVLLCLGCYKKLRKKGLDKFVEKIMAKRKEEDRPRIELYES